MILREILSNEQKLHHFIDNNSSIIKYEFLILLKILTETLLT